MMRAVGNRLACLVVSRPRTVLLGALVVALAVLPFGLRLRLATNLVDLVPRSAPGTAAFARYSQAFSAEQSLVILVEASDPARLLEFAARYAAELRRLPGVTQVRERIGPGAAALLRDHLLTFLDDEDLASLATRITPAALDAQARRLRSLIAAPGGAALAPLLVADPLELLPLISRRLQAGLPVDTTSGYFRSADGQALLLFVQARHSTFDIEANRHLLAQAAEAARRTGGELGDVSALAPDAAAVPVPAPPGPTVWFTGAYAYAVEYRDWLHHDLQLSTLVSAVTVLLSFALLLGAVRVLPLVALPLGLGLWLTAAAAAVLFGQLSAVSLAFGTILLSIGIDVPIQLYNRLREELARLLPELATETATETATEATVHRAVEHTVARLAGPSLIATLGPALVFACCGLSRYRGLAELGTLAGLGLVLNLLVMLTVLPALLVWLPARWWLPKRRPPTEGASLAWIGRHAARHPRAVLLVTGLVALAAAPAALRLRYQDHLITVEPAGMRAARVTREVERRMGQRRSVLIALVEHQDREQALVHSDRWRVVAEQLRRRGLLVSYQSISNLFPSGTEQARRRAALERLGPRRIAVDLRAALGQTGFDTTAFEPFLRQLEVPPRPLTLADAGPDLQFLVAHHVQDLPEARLVATYLFPTPDRLDEAQEALAAVAATAAVTKDGPAGQLTGLPVLEKTLHELLRRDLLRVTLASVAAVALLLVLYYREARPVLAVLVPLSLAWVLFAALLGLLDIPLNLFNLLTVPLVVGYGIDDHVFLVQRHRELGAGPAEALGSTGRAIVVTSLSTMAGFAGLMVARFDGLRVLGSSGALAVALCLLAAFAMLPALLALLFVAVTQEPRVRTG